jgi:prevent-host-death family protein
MATYSLAQAKDQLSKLVDQALSGEPVTITRHGKPVVHLTPAQPAPRPMTRKEIEELARFRDTLPPLPVSGADLIRRMRDEDWS